MDTQLYEQLAALFIDHDAPEPLQRLIELIEHERTHPRRPGWVAPLAETSHLTAQQLAIGIVYCACVLRGGEEEDEERHPALLTVVLRLNGLRDPAAKGVQKNTGLFLLQLALDAGLCKLKQEQRHLRGGYHRGRYRRGGWRTTRRVVPTDHGLECFVSIADVFHVRPVPPTTPTLVRRNRRALPDDPESVASPDAQRAARTVRDTPWRINQRTLGVVTRMAASAQLEGDDDNAVSALRIGEVWLRDRFYLPTVFDFRGRIYQTGPITYTSGSDVERALLEFADGRVIPRASPEWSAAENSLNSYAASLLDAPALTFDDWRRVISDPVKNQDWREAKECWRFLAALLALDDLYAGRALHLPVAIDATQSGMQHVAYLLRDNELARHSNVGRNYDLIDDAQDFYNYIRNKLRDELGIDLDRKTVKAVAMPMLYGATLEHTRAALQHTQFSAKPVHDFVGKLLRTDALLLFFKSLAEAAARDGKGVSWESPSGFRVEDWSRVMQKEAKTLVEATGFEPPLGRKDGLVRMRTASYGYPGDKFSGSGLMPNFVHSLDAALLTRVINTGAARGINHWGVAHDAAAVPAWRAHELKEVIADAMDRMYRGRDVLVDAWCHTAAAKVEAKIAEQELTRGDSLDDIGFNTLSWGY